MKIAIVDDEKEEQQIIVKYISEWAQTRQEPAHFSCFDNSESFLFGWEDNKDYDLLVLDIEMGKMNGLELAGKIREEDKQMPIMFITGYDEYMQYGYDVSALHYLIKPVNKNRLFTVLDKWKETKKDEAEPLIINVCGAVHRVQINNIMYVEANGHGSIMHTVDTQLHIKESLGEIEKQVLSTDEMIKCHRAFLVNLRFISAIQNSDIILDNEERLPISRKQMKNVQQAFLKYYKRQV